MKRLLRIALRKALVEYKEPNFCNLVTYLQEHNPLLRAEMNLKEDKFNESYDGIIDRLAQVISDPRMRRILCNPHKLDFDQVIDEGLILIVSLSRVEKVLVPFLGTLLFQGLQSAILDRDVPDRKPIAVYIDEFQDYIVSHYAVKDFQRLFAQGRHNQVSLCVAHQDFGQIDFRLLDSVHGNAAGIISFGCGAKEAAQMSRIFGTGFPAEQIQKQPDHICTALIDNEVFRIETYEPPEKERILKYKEMIYTKPDPPDPFIRLSPRYSQPKDGKIKGNERRNRPITPEDVEFTPDQIRKKPKGGQGTRPKP